MATDDGTRVEHMLVECRDIVAFTKGHVRSDLNTNRMLAKALVHSIQILGEAAQAVAGVLKDEHPEIPWRRIQGMRHRIVHDYPAVDLDIMGRCYRTCTGAHALTRDTG